MKWILNDEPQSWAKGKIFPSIVLDDSALPEDDQCDTDIPATEWVVEGETRAKAVDHMIECLEELLPEGVEVSTEADGADLVPVPDSITVKDVSKWVNAKPQADRYGGSARGGADNPAQACARDSPDDR